MRAEADAPGVLVHSVDLKSMRTGMGLQFKRADGHVVASLQLHAKPLRQWPSKVWPAWVTEAKPAHSKGRGAAVLH